MKLDGARILLTGASGGLGSALATALARRGARLGLAGRRHEPLQALAGTLATAGAEVVPLVEELTADGAPGRLVQAMQAHFGGIDVLVNNAGISAFTDFASQDPASIAATVQTNVTAPLLLTRAVLPQLLAQGHGAVVNIGSMFGSIACAWFAGYSTSKFALRGFSEALRREVAGSGVAVLYAAPRALRTPINGPAVERMAAAIDMPMDDPAPVAERIVRALERGRKEIYLGYPEALFVRLNGLLPRLVDTALRRQNRQMRRFLGRA
jgi:short-subunit dehydrogenase